MALGGPRISQGDVLHLFGGRLVFRQSCRGMNLIHRAVLRGDMRPAPVNLRRWAEWERPEMGPPFHEYLGWRRHHLDSEQIFWRDVPGMGEEITRYLAQQDTDEYFQEPANENWPSDTDTDTEEDDWSRPPPINATNAEWFYK